MPEAVEGKGTHNPQRLSHDDRETAQFLAWIDAKPAISAATVPQGLMSVELL